jgi:phage gpG-like protein
MLIRIETVGLQDAMARIHRLTDDGFHTDLLTMCGAKIQEQTTRRFVSTKMSPEGAKWAPIKVSGGGRRGKKKAKQKRRSTDILVDTGRLMGSIMSSVLNSKQVEVGTNVEYAGYIQGGTRKMVARPFLGVAGPDEPEIENMAAHFIKGVLGV